ncbi:MAG: CCA tRNA nucleotidyltransferase [Bacilli bacterium]|nr:CCA tRNA nucleotidyltransferase [Bacilli bacterium]
MLPKEFIKLAKLFKRNGYQLYLVGGSARDYLLKRPFFDLDLASDATPSEIKEFLPDADFTFARFGNVHLKHIDITTFREEEDYSDYRHPRKVVFTRQIEKDYSRRDFTINALYIDINEKVYDFCHGLDDLKAKIIRFIGDPTTRIKEDPLRILRAERFAKTLGFQIEENAYLAMKKLYKLIDKINTNKIKQELAKEKSSHI